MRSWSTSDVKLALDVLDWFAVWGSAPVCFERWRFRMFPTTKAKSAQRTWLRTKAKLEACKMFRHHIEISVDPTGVSKGRSIAVLHRATVIADSYLDEVEIARVAKRRAMARRRAKEIRDIDARIDADCAAEEAIRVAASEAARNARRARQDAAKRKKLNRVAVRMAVTEGAREARRAKTAARNAARRKKRPAGVAASR